MARLLEIILQNSIKKHKPQNLTNTTLGSSPSSGTTYTSEKAKFSIKDFFSKCEEILNGKIHFLCSVRETTKSITVIVFG